MNRVARSVVAAGAMLMAGSANAAVMFYDDLNTDYPSLTYNITSLNNWTAMSGKVVDYLLTGDYETVCDTGCIDIDGSQYVGGGITSNDLFQFYAGNEYTLSFESEILAGNPGASEFVQFGVDGMNSSTVEVSNIGTMQLYSYTFTAANDQLAALFFTTPSTDNYGAIIDNIKLESNPVPVPGSLALIGIGMIGLAMASKKRASEMRRA